MNNKPKPTVALIYGGRGAEAEVSLKGAEYVLPLISREKYKPLAVFIDRDGRWLCGGGEVTPAYLGGISGLYREGDMIPLDCAIPLLHGDFGEDGVVQGALENAKIPYVGCNTVAGAIICDKAATKAVAKSLSIPTLPFKVITRPSEGTEAEEELGYPLIVKPCTLGSSVGISVARNRDELPKAISNALSLCPRVIIEKYLSTPRELECGYFSANCKEIFTDPGEISYTDGFYDYEKKYLGRGRVTISHPAKICESISNRIKEYTARLIRALGIRDLCRADFFLQDDRLYFNEINTMPGFTEESLYPKMMKDHGIETEGLIDILIRQVIDRRA